MKSSDIDHIAKKCNTSRATVVRVVNHCCGVDGCTRETVLAAADDANGAPRAAVDIYVIFPDNPKYFWHNILLSSKNRYAGKNVKLNVYSSIDNPGTMVKRYLDDAERLGAKAIIIAARLDAEDVAKLTALAKSRLVIQICNYTPIENSFFVGSDFYRDGSKLAKFYIEGHRAAKNFILLSHDGDYPINERLRGFFDACSERGAGVRYVAIPDGVNSRLLSSVLARELARIPDIGGTDCIFTPDGITSQVCLAVLKLKLQKKIDCVGFEHSPEDDGFLKSGMIAALAVQRVERHFETAMTLSERFVRERVFPDCKMLYIESDIIQAAPR